MIRRTNPQWGFWSNWAYGFVFIATGLVQVLSLGLLCSSWTLDYARYRMKQMFAKLKAQGRVP